ncbi:hypothetical protein OEZ86_014509 [Tetradesmus obliquus]|nr:hypothetical protein OEZ86_014509 [Tetradesmus obliquus]
MLPCISAQYEPVPAVRGGLPYIGVLHRTPVNQLFSFVEREFAETGVRCLDLQVFGRHAVYTRHPEDISSVLRNPSKWTKAPLMMKRLDRWLGEGLVSELDPARHAAARDVLAPAFRAQSVKDLVPLFADVGQQLAAALLSQAGSTIELEPITRRATLDVIGRAGFGHYFGALQMAQQQQQQQDQVDVVKLFDDILDTSMLLIMNPPLPDALVPGHSSYCAAVDALEAVALRLLQERRQQGISPKDRSLLSFMLAAQQECRQQGIKPDDRSLLSFMRAAQQAAPGGLVSDKHIRDQLMTFMLAGSDTSLTHLAFFLFELSFSPHFCPNHMSVPPFPSPSVHPQERRQQGISPQDRSLLSFMLAAQQAAPGGLVSDNHIRDQLMTFMLAGSDTSLTHLAFFPFELSFSPHFCPNLMSVPPFPSASVHPQERRQQGISPQDRSLLSFMLAAQQAAPGGLVSDKHIRDQLMTFMLAGSDTSLTHLAFFLFELSFFPHFCPNLMSVPPFPSPSVHPQERRQLGISPQDRSLLSFMLAAQQAAPGGLVSDKHIRDQLMTFMLAGSDTSATSLAFCLYELARRPQAQQAVRQELQQVLEDTPIDQLQPDAFSSLPYLTGCINECLRLYPAAPGLARIPQQDAVLGPHLVPQGLPVVVDFFSCHRHPEFWPRASEWLPERWLPSNLKALGPQHPDAFMPFSAGSRSCIGRYFAMLEMQVMLAVVLRQLSFAAVGGEGSGQAAAAQSFTLKSRDGLRVVPTAAGR